MTESQTPQEFTLRGIGISPGIVSGEATLIEGGDLRIPRYRITPPEVDEQIARIRRALEETEAEIRGTRDRLADVIGEGHLFILDSHLMILVDEILVGETIETIRQNRWNAEAALEDTLARHQAKFSDIDNEYLRDRRNDIRQVGRHIQRNLMGVEAPLAPQKGSPVILVAHDLTAADLLRINPGQILGFITELGGRTSHNAIIAGTLGIPAILGLTRATRRIRQGDKLALDGGTGLVRVHPTSKTLEDADRLRKRYDRRQRDLRRLRDLPCETTDGVRVTLRANIGSPAEVDVLHERGARGVGLYRTEYLFLNRSDLPTEQEHFDVYRRVMEGVSPDPAVFRTFDLGGDVTARTLESAEEANPVLGLRAIRLALAKTDVLRTQLRALLKASAQGSLGILHPFISGLEEVRSVDALMRDLAAELDTEGVRLPEFPPVGVLVETPAAALMADVLAREVSFFTIGTNDLTQYTLAADRGNERVSYLYDPLHPAVLRLIRGVIDSAVQAGIEVSVCGEMAADPTSAALLVGMGIRELSMSPHRIPRIKEVLRGVSAAQAERWAQEALGLPSAEEIHVWAERNLKFSEFTARTPRASVALDRTG
ncbi:MAG: phosphoenolpyruvate--protein phosphotransferase [Nitrospinota bacterium]|nr:phosphoenolpyruvate--protein phosphotransferase [Nitrospinota bacterium]